MADINRIYLCEQCMDLLVNAQNGDKISEDKLLVIIRDKFMNRRIGKYLYKNRLVEDEDMRQEFMIGVALNIHKARLDMGDPIEYLINQGVYRVRSYLRKNIVCNTSQTCLECGHITRINRVGTDYICKKCGSNNIETHEISDHNDLLMESMADTEDIETDILSKMLLEEFEKTLNPNTNVFSLYTLIKSGVNRDNPNIKNYIKTIAKLWGGCSEQNVVQNMDRLKSRLTKFAHEHNMEIVDNQFVFIDVDERMGNL